MMDQIIDAAMARSLHRDAVRTHPLSVWIVMEDQPECPDQLVAQLVTDEPGSYILVADTLGELRAQLPAGLVRSERQPSDPQGVVEVWYSAEP